MMPGAQCVSCIDRMDAREMRMMLNAAFGIISYQDEDAAACMSQSVTALAFLEWLREGIETRRIPVNQRGAMVHRCADGVLIASPAVFKAYVRDHIHDALTWEQVQRAVQRQRRWRIGDGIRMFLFQGKRKHGLHGLVLSIEVLPVRHQVNPLIREARPSRGKSRHVPS